MRGEHCIPIPLMLNKAGSSPHARGARRRYIILTVDFGIIPACAGSTMQSLRSFPKVRDHPRMRGEHGGYRHRCVISKGSSPHARGAHRNDTDEDGLQGIIPACAGSTPVHLRRYRRAWDHPRMRGEHNCVAVSI